MTSDQILSIYSESPPIGYRLFRMNMKTFAFTDSAFLSMESDLHTKLLLQLYVTLYMHHGREIIADSLVKVLKIGWSGFLNYDWSSWKINPINKLSESPFYEIPWKISLLNVIYIRSPVSWTGEKILKFSRFCPLWSPVHRSLTAILFFFNMISIKIEKVISFYLTW